MARLVESCDSQYARSAFSLANFGDAFNAAFNGALVCLVVNRSLLWAMTFSLAFIDAHFPEIPEATICV